MDRALELVLTILQCLSSADSETTHLTRIMWHILDSSTEPMGEDEVAGLQGPSSTIFSFHMDSPALPVRALIDLFNGCAQPDVELHAIGVRFEPICKLEAL